MHKYTYSYVALYNKSKWVINCTRGLTGANFVSNIQDCLRILY